MKIFSASRSDPCWQLQTRSRAGCKQIDLVEPPGGASFAADGRARADAHGGIIARARLSMASVERRARLKEEGWSHFWNENLA